MYIPKKVNTTYTTQYIISIIANFFMNFLSSFSENIALYPKYDNKIVNTLQRLENAIVNLFIS